MKKKQKKRLDKKALKAVNALEKYEIEFKRVGRENEDEYTTKVSYCQFGSFTFIFTNDKDIGNSLIDEVENKHIS